MTSVAKPIDIRPFFNEARAFVKTIAPIIPLTSAILDDWKGPRIIYGGPSIENCNNRCEECLLFKTVGADPAQQAGFRTTLYFAAKEYLDILPSKQRCLNCKTLSQYQAAFIEYIYQRCLSQETLAVELDWVKGFKVVFLNGVYDKRILWQKEKRSKSFIVYAVLKRMKQNHDPRQEFTHRYAKKIRLI